MDDCVQVSKVSEELFPMVCERIFRTDHAACRLSLEL